MWKIFRKMLIFIIFVQFHYVYEITDYYVLNVRPKLKKNSILKSNENDSHKYLLYFIWFAQNICRLFCLFQTR